MNAIDRQGTFRGKITDKGVSESSGGFPQMVATLLALEFYDETGSMTGPNPETPGNPGWVDWSQYEQGTVGYFILYNRDEKTATGWKESLNAQQIKKTLGWDGRTFEGLDALNVADTVVLFRVEPWVDRNGNEKLQVCWIDTADASPTKTLKKYDTTKLKELTSKFSGVLSATAPAVTPAKAPAGKPAATPPKRGPGRPKATPTPAAGPAAPASPAAPSTATPPPAGPAPAPSVPSGPPAGPTTATKASAWESVSTMKGKDVTDEKLTETWIAKVQSVMTAAGAKTEDDLTPQNWAEVQKAVADATSMF